MDHHDVLRPVRRALKQFESERVDSPTSVTASWTFRFEVTEDEEDGGWVARCVNLPGCWVQGDTQDELARNMETAVEEVLAVRLAGQFDESGADLSDLKVAAGH